MVVGVLGPLPEAPVRRNGRSLLSRLASASGQKSKVNSVLILTSLAGHARELQDRSAGHTREAHAHAHNRRKLQGVATARSRDGDRLGAWWRWGQGGRVACVCLGAGVVSVK